MSKSQSKAESQRQILSQAIELQQRGNLKAAERKYRSILKDSPDHTDALQFLAVLLQETGKESAALHFMQKALDKAANNPVLNSNQAEIYRMQGNYDSAEKYAEKALALNPDLLDPLVILGSVYQNSKNYQLAAEYYCKALDITPDDVFVRNELGNVYSVLERFNDAVAEYQLALNQDSEFDDCRLNLADTLLELYETEEAISHYQRLIKNQPDNIKFLIKLAQALITVESKDTQTIVDKILKLDKSNAEAHYWQGIHQQTIGRFGQASESFKTAIALKPDYFAAWYRLSLNKGYIPDDDDIDLLQSRFDQLQTESPDLISLGFTLGRFFEQKDDTAEAFRYYQAANRVKTRQQPFDKDKHDEQIDNIINIFDTDFYAKRLDWGNPGHLPLFIVGMPRSGTTLVEQILASHTQIHGGGELPMMLKLVSGLKLDTDITVSSHAQRIAAMNKDELSLLSDQYIDKLQSLSQTATLISDKLPGNYFRLGVIFLLFPNATIIHCQRGAMDTCWSCYQQNFESGLRFTNDLESLGYAYRGYQRLMQHWHSINSGRILDIKYESLLEDPEVETRRLLEHCNLDWQSEVLQFHQQQRPVSTASLWQVRQPLYKSSVGKWEAYEPFLQPLKALLGV